MERTYSIYKITSPSGKCYIGLTKSKLSERWRQHCRKSKTLYNHPFYCAIRKYGADKFKVEVIDSGLTKEQAQKREIQRIAELSSDLTYNISSGGECDGIEGGKIFWERINADPKAREEYLKKLSEVKLNSDWSDYEAINASNVQWRLDNPKTAYKQSMRALRIINRNVTPKKTDTRPLKEKLLWKHRRDLATKRAVTKVWSNRDSRERRIIFDKIGAKAKDRLSKLNEEDKRKLTTKARNSIDRSVQGPAASKGIKQFWVELRKDPEAYSAYIKTRRDTLMLTLERKKNENL